MKRDIFSLSEYNYQVPSELIAQEPVCPRDSCRLLVVERQKKALKEIVFKEVIDLLSSGDVLVLNDTRVIKARLLGQTENGGKIEVLLLKQKARGLWEVLVKPGKRARAGQKIIFEPDRLEAEIVAKTDQGGRVLKFHSPDLEATLEQIGRAPTPPYIKKEVNDPQDYQTVYARRKGAVAAPTAGLHFTPQLLTELKHKGVKIVKITLHCGLATFRPVKTADIRKHKIEPEWIEVSPRAAQEINKAKLEGRKVIAVGTTAVRALESVAFLSDSGLGQVKPGSGETNLYIVPGYKFKIIDFFLTNFHTPASTNLILAAAFCGIDRLKESYAWARARKFRFFSFGDAMLIR